MRNFSSKKRRRAKKAGTGVRVFSIKNKRRFIIVSVAVLLLAGLALFLFADRPLSNEDKARLRQTLVYRDGVSVAGVDLSGMTYEQALGAVEPVKQQMHDDATIELVYEDQTWDLTPENMKFSYNWDEQMENALFVGYQGSLITQWSQTGAKTLNFEVTYTYEESNVKTAVDAVVDEINSPPKEPYAEINKSGSGGKFIYHEGSPGLETDETEVFTTVMEQLKNKDHTPITLKAVKTEPKKTVDDIRAVTKLVSGFTTNIPSSSSQNRRDNIKKLAGIINCQIIQPGEEFSINALAGIRTEESGWKLAPGIENGTYTDQPGGGVCQVSSTLYNAVLLGDFKVTARQHHSWPSSYVKIGRDATISSYGPDFKFVNNQNNPIYIFAYATNYKCSVEIYGKPLDYTITLESVITETITPPTPKYTKDPTKPMGEEDELSPSKSGYRVEVYKHYYKDGKQYDKVLDHQDYYRPFQGEISVGSMPTPAPTPTPKATPAPQATKTPAATPAKTSPPSSPGDS
ncbi:MAG: VanW family protein [Bacillota bacterium]